MSNSYNVLHDWWIWVIIIGLVIGVILVVIFIILEFPGLCDCKSYNREKSETVDFENGFEVEDKVKNSLREKSSNFVRKISGHGRHGKQSPSPAMERKHRHKNQNKSSSVRNSFKASREFVRKLSQKGVTNDDKISKNKCKYNETEEDPVIRITQTSARGSFKVSADFITKLTLGNRRQRNDNINEDNDNDTTEKARKTGICVIDYYPPIKEYAVEEEEKPEQKGKILRQERLDDNSECVEINC